MNFVISALEPLGSSGREKLSTGKALDGKSSGREKL
jgi:hypothetical protein